MGPLLKCCSCCCEPSWSPSNEGKRPNPAERAVLAWSPPPGEMLRLKKTLYACGEPSRPSGSMMESAREIGRWPRGR